MRKEENLFLYVALPLGSIIGTIAHSFRVTIYFHADSVRFT